MKRPDSHGNADIEPRRTGPTTRPFQTRAASQIPHQQASADHLKPGVPRVDFRVSERDIAGVVPTHQGKWHFDRANGPAAAFHGIDTEIEVARRATRLSVLRNDGVFHGRQSPTGTIESWAG